MAESQQTGVDLTLNLLSNVAFCIQAPVEKPSFSKHLLFIDTSCKILWTSTCFDVRHDFLVLTSSLNTARVSL